jgi:hypothetical protein
MTTRRVSTMVLGATALGSALLLGGCIIAPIVENYKRTSTHTIKAEYTKLQDKTFAVIVTSGRGIESESPGITDAMMERISFRLAQKEVGASGVIPPRDVIKSLYNHPAWQSKTYAELAKDLLGGVDRLVYIELEEFRKTEPGNNYEWDGMASGRVMVIESDGIDPNRIVFEKLVSVQFPTKKGLTPDSLSANAVASTLLSHFVDRASWLFYDHQEPYYPEY